jgi:hypothetical protein
MEFAILDHVSMNRCCSVCAAIESPDAGSALTTSMQGTLTQIGIGFSDFIMLLLSYMAYVLSTYRYLGTESNVTKVSWNAIENHDYLDPRGYLLHK